MYENHNERLKSHDNETKRVSEAFTFQCFLWCISTTGSAISKSITFVVAVTIPATAHR